MNLVSHDPNMIKKMLLVEKIWKNFFIVQTDLEFEEEVLLQFLNFFCYLLDYLVFSQSFVILNEFKPELSSGLKLSSYLHRLIKKSLKKILKADKSSAFQMHPPLYHKI